MKATDVISGNATWAVEQADALAWLRSLPPLSIDLFVSSCPYMDARTYGIGGQRKCLEWVEWMLPIIAEAHRVTKGPVFLNCAGVTRERNYWPGCEGLAWEWWKRGGDCQLYRPCVFRRVGIPGSGGIDYLRADWEYVLCFKHAGELPWSDNTACGHPPKWAPGGEMSNRLTDGTRTNQWGKTGTDTGTRQLPGGQVKHGKARPSHLTVKSSTRRHPNGKREKFGHDADGAVKGGHAREIPKRHTRGKGRQADGEKNERDLPYVEPAMANPGNVIQRTYTAAEVEDLLAEAGDVRDVLVGGGVMGDKICHRNEAPFPEDLPRFFIRSFCPPGGIVGDCFVGSGTTAKVAVDEGRRAVACDLRQSQVDLTVRRLESTTLPLFA